MNEKCSRFCRYPLIHTMMMIIIIIAMVMNQIICILVFWILTFCRQNRAYVSVRGRLRIREGSSRRTWGEKKSRKKYLIGLFDRLLYVFIFVWCCCAKAKTQTHMSLGRVSYCSYIETIYDSRYYFSFVYLRKKKNAIWFCVWCGAFHFVLK